MPGQTERSLSAPHQSIERTLISGQISYETIQKPDRELKRARQTYLKRAALAVDYLE
jgi:hypothetical protein